MFGKVRKTSAKFMWSYFSSKNLSYNLRKGPSLSLPSTKLQSLHTVHGTNYVHFKGTLIWNNPISLNPVPQFLSLKEI